MTLSCATTPHTSCFSKSYRYKIKPVFTERGRGAVFFLIQVHVTRTRMTKIRFRICSLMTSASSRFILTVASPRSRAFFTCAPGLAKVRHLIFQIFFILKLILSFFYDSKLIKRVLVSIQNFCKIDLDLDPRF